MWACEQYLEACMLLLDDTGALFWSLELFPSQKKTFKTANFTSHEFSTQKQNCESKKRHP